MQSKGRQHNDKFEAEENIDDNENAEMKEESGQNEETVSNLALSRLFFVVGHAAMKELVHLEILPAAKKALAPASSSEKIPKANRRQSSKRARKDNSKDEEEEEDEDTTKRHKETEREAIEIELALTSVAAQEETETEWLQQVHCYCIFFSEKRKKKHSLKKMNRSWSMILSRVL
jgi:hypothetical protein